MSGHRFTFNPDAPAWNGWQAPEPAPAEPAPEEYTESGEADPHFLNFLAMTQQMGVSMTPEQTMQAYAMWCQSGGMDPTQMAEGYGSSYGGGEYSGYEGYDPSYHGGGGAGGWDGGDAPPEDGLTEEDYALMHEFEQEEALREINKVLDSMGVRDEEERAALAAEYLGSGEWEMTILDEYMEEDGAELMEPDEPSVQEFNAFVETAATTGGGGGWAAFLTNPAPSAAAGGVDRTKAPAPQAAAPAPAPAPPAPAPAPVPAANPVAKRQFSLAAADYKPPTGGGGWGNF